MIFINRNIIGQLQCQNKHKHTDRKMLQDGEINISSNTREMLLEITLLIAPDIWMRICRVRIVQNLPQLQEQCLSMARN